MRRGQDLLIKVVVGVVILAGVLAMIQSIGLKFGGTDVTGNFGEALYNLFTSVNPALKNLNSGSTSQLGIGIACIVAIIALIYTYLLTALFNSTRVLSDNDCNSSVIVFIF